MPRGFRFLLVSAVVASSLVVGAGAQSSQSADIRLKLGDLLFSEGRYQEALAAYRTAVRVAPPDLMGQARSSLVVAALRVAEFDEARVEAGKLLQASPRSPEAMALAGDTLWASGLFQQAEEKYHDALAASPDLARGRHGMARSLAARGMLIAAMNEAQTALKLSPRDFEIHHTVGTLYERM